LLPAVLQQVRGSIPLLWSQIPNIKYKPTTRLLAAGSPTSAAFDAHFDALLAKYKVGCCRTGGLWCVMQQRARLDIVCLAG
jgi:hypothetical protein